jgi:hypothetical protein
LGHRKKKKKVYKPRINLVFRYLTQFWNFLFLDPYWRQVLIYAIVNNTEDEYKFFVGVIQTVRGPASVVGIATGYGLDGPGIESLWGEIFFTCPDRPWDPPSLLYKGNRVFPGDKERPGRGAVPSPPSSVVVMKESSYTSTPPMGRTACTEPQWLYKDALYLTYF